MTDLKQLSRSIDTMHAIASLYLGHCISVRWPAMAKYYVYWLVLLPYILVHVCAIGCCIFGFRKFAVTSVASMLTAACIVNGRFLRFKGVLMHYIASATLRHSIPRTSGESLFQ